MAVYTCPTCGEKMERDLLLFQRHTDEHIISEIKKSHPSWITDDGYCPRCLDYYKKSVIGSSEESERKYFSIGPVNIGSGESRKRLYLGVASLLLAVFVFAGLKSASQNPSASFMLFPLFFIASFCLVQARRNICVILSYKGTRNMDQKEQKISNAEEISALRRESNKILLYSSIFGVAATGVCFLLLRV